MNILSLDWDYFIDATFKERYSMFPDGGNEMISGSMSDIIWQLRYADSMNFKKYNNKNLKLLQDIKVDEHAVDGILSVICKRKKPDTKLTVAIHHMEITELITSIDKPVNVYNADFHHDLYSFGDELDSGSWARLLLESGNIDSYHWLKRKDSDKPENTETDFKTYISANSFDKSISGKLDHIFICLSPVWTPPHLDGAFKNLLVNIAYILDTEVSVMLPDRWNSKKKKEIEQLAGEMEKFISVTK